MQPYIFPYIGYFQLINAVEKFVIYDNIQYTKKGWINRNRYLQNGKDAFFSISLKKDSDFLDVKDRVISPDFNKAKLLNQIRAAYKNALYFELAYAVFEKVILNNETNLFNYIFFSVKEVCRYLSIETSIIKSSDINIDHNLKSQAKVIAICEELGAHEYINAIGGQNLYSKQAFNSHNISLKFIKSKSVTYQQFDNEFIPWLSIIDVMMFNSIAEIQKMLDEYELI